MPTKGGRQQKIKRLKYKIKEAIFSNQDPFPFYQQLAALVNIVENPPTNFENSINLQEIEFEINYPNYKTIPKTDPRRPTYKTRYLFG